MKVIIPLIIAFILYQSFTWAADKSNETMLDRTRAFECDIYNYDDC